MRKSTLIFDGDCGFCRHWIEYWKSLTKDAIEYAPYQEVADQFPQIKKEEFEKAVQLVESNGNVSAGAKAVFKALESVALYRWLFWLYQHIKLFAWLSERAYQCVANHRKLASSLTRLFWGSPSQPSTYLLSQTLFLKALALIYFIAFVSLWTQIHGLIGSHGILPAPVSDFVLHGICALGVLASASIFANLIPLLGLIISWLSYFVLTELCWDFLAFQWDALLLEMGFLAIFFVRYSSAVHVLFRWLLFRLMFGSGLVKILAGDLAWRSLTALQYHYETQPLPTWIGWYVHQLPLTIHKISAGAMFCVELVLPFFIFLPRRFRQVAVFGFLGLQLMIGLTGNYGFFGLQVVALCLLLLDDQDIARILPSRLKLNPKARREFSPLLVLLTLVIFTATIFYDTWISDWAKRLRIVSSYGVFAVMTVDRGEIEIQGSADGKTWQTYEFKWKPNSPEQRPAFVAPHMPRLDWQMWFAARSSFEQSYWLQSVSVRILQNSPDVLKLFKTNPFSNGPPQQLRLMFYEYRFTTPEEKKATGHWWVRELKGNYSPEISLRKE